MSNWTNLAPEICRQRMIIEGTLHNPFPPKNMERYCKEVSKVLDMTPVATPHLSFEEKYGWCCFMHWKVSNYYII